MQYLQTLIRFKDENSIKIINIRNLIDKFQVSSYIL